MEKDIPISATSIDDAMWKIRQALVERYGTSVAEREFSPLAYYVDTGRASTIFLRKLINANPTMVARVLHRGGSDAQVISGIKYYLNYKSCDI